MISRRLLRIKALQVLYAYYLSDQAILEKSKKELLFSVEKTYELYHYLILLILEIADYAESRMDIAKAKYLPTEAEVNPNIRFVSNPVILALRNNPEFNKYISIKKISWVNYPELTKSIYRQMIEAPEYQTYMSEAEVSFSQHKKIIGFLLTELIFNNELFHQILEEQSIYWNDDLEFAGSMAYKTVDGAKESGKVKWYPKFKNEDDREFMLDLFQKTIRNADENRALIKRFAENWEFERIAQMDIFIMQMAITEAIEFPSIPTRVTFNEFIEISKYYSTEKSSQFINGILDKAFQTLKEEKRIHKTGRGLIGESKD